MRIGTQIRRLREARGWSQDALAAALKLSQSTVSRIEKDEQEPSIDQLEALAAAFEIEIEHLIQPEKVKVDFESLLKTKDELIRAKEEIIQLLKTKIETLEQKIPDT